MIDFVEEKDDIENEIRKKKSKKLSKHFNILVNGEKTKILNYLIKDFKNDYDCGQVIELISKIKFKTIKREDRENVIIIIENDKEKIIIEGKAKSGSYSVGNYLMSFLICSFSTVEKQDR